MYQKSMKPNILFIQSDSMDGRVMGCAGHPAAYTPNLDRLAGRGTLFANAYCNSPQCVPSRASMWSGRHVHTIGAWNNFKGITEEDRTFQTELDENGYRTKIIGRTDHLSGKHSALARVTAWTRAAGITLPQKDWPGVEVVDPDTGRVHTHDWETVGRCQEWLRENAGTGTAPFMLSCGFSAPHPDFKTSRYWLSKIDRNKVTIPPYEETLHPVMEYMSRTKSCFGPFTTEELLDIRQAYYAMIAEVDAMVGTLLDTLDELGLTDSTYVVYTSDHGEMSMEHRLWLKNAMYEASVRVPLLIAGPGVKKGERAEELVSLVDMYPTLMDMAGIEKRSELEGSSLMPLLRGETAGHPDYVLSQYHSNMQNTGSFMLRQGNWKYIAYAGYEPQLFDVIKDPGEMNNMAEACPDTVRQLDARLRSLLDYVQVDRQAKEYDQDAFSRWRREIGEEKYRAAIREIYPDWDAECDQKIENWLKGSSCSGSWE